MYWNWRKKWKTNQLNLYDTICFKNKEWWLYVKTSSPHTNRACSFIWVVFHRYFANIWTNNLFCFILFLFTHFRKPVRWWPLKSSKTVKVCTQQNECSAGFIDQLLSLETKLCSIWKYVVLKKKVSFHKYQV